MHVLFVSSVYLLYLYIRVYVTCGGGIPALVGFTGYIIFRICTQKQATTRNFVYIYMAAQLSIGALATIRHM